MVQVFFQDNGKSCYLGETSKSLAHSRGCPGCKPSGCRLFRGGSRIGKLVLVADASRVHHQGYCIVVLCWFDIFWLVLSLLVKRPRSHGSFESQSVFVLNECWMFCERPPFQPARRWIALEMNGLPDMLNFFWILFWDLLFSMSDMTAMSPNNPRNPKSCGGSRNGQRPRCTFPRKWAWKVYLSSRLRQSESRGRTCKTLVMQTCSPIENRTNI